MLADAAAERLFNTPTVCRKSYIHPAVLALADLPSARRAALLTGLPCPEIAELRASERRLLALLDPEQGG